MAAVSPTGRTPVEPNNKPIVDEGAGEPVGAARQTSSARPSLYALSEAGGSWAASGDIPAADPPVGVGPELPFQLHKAPHFSAVDPQVGLDVGCQFADGGQVEAEQLRAVFQRCRDRPAQIRVVPGPHADSVSNTCSKSNREFCLPGPKGHGWMAHAAERSGSFRRLFGEQCMLAFEPPRWSAVIVERLSVSGGSAPPGARPALPYLPMRGEGAA